MAMLQSMGTRRQRIILLVIVYGTMVLFGFIQNTRGVIFPLIKNEFNATHDEQGIMVSLHSFAYVAACAVAGIFLSRFGLKSALLAGFVSMTIGLGSFSLSSSFWMTAGLFLLLYAGGGFFEIGLNAMGSRIFTVRSALMMNLLHFFYGLGAIAGPRAAGFLSGTLEYGWRRIYAFYLIPVCLMAVLVFFVSFPGDKDEDAAEGERKKRISLGSALKQPFVWVAASMLGFSSAMETGTVNWSALHLQDVYGLDPRTAGAAFVSAFFIVFTCSRLISGFVIEKIGYLRSLFGASVILAGIFALGFLLGEKGLWILPGTGFFLAVMWPTTLGLIIRVFKKDAPIVNSAIIMMSGILSGTIQFVMGFVNRYIGEAWGYRCCFVWAILLGINVLFFRKHLRSVKAAA